MNDTHSTGCDDDLLVRCLDNDLNADEKTELAAHLKACGHCRRQLSVMEGFSHDLRSRVDQAAEAVDFTAMEKDVLTKGLRTYRAGNEGLGFFKALKYGIPAAVTAGLLLFFGYNQCMVQANPAPSAIINSFTGSMSSVMIFETPETRQTILWYTEDVDVESESDAV